MDAGIFMVASLTAGAGIGAQPYLSKIRFVGTSIDEIIKQVNSQILKADIEALVGLACCTICCVLGYSSYKTLMEQWRLNKLANLANNAARENSKIVKDEILKIDSYSCSACKMEPRAIVYGPCKHMLYCRECWEQKIDKEKCEKCHADIKNTSRIFLN